MKVGVSASLWLPSILRVLRFLHPPVPPPFLPTVNFTRLPVHCDCRDDTAGVVVVVVGGQGLPGNLSHQLRTADSVALNEYVFLLFIV